MNVKAFNDYNSGFRKGDLFVISCTRKKNISMSFIECKYGNIEYRFLSQDPSYNLKYKNFEVDVDYSYNELERGYNLKCALYSGDSIIGFKSKIAHSLRDGLINICEEMIEERL